MSAFTPVNSLQFFLLSARWLVCFDKNECCCLGDSQRCPRKMVQVCGWEAGNGGRDLISIWWYCCFWPVHESHQTLALILKLVNFETNQIMEIGLELFFIVSSVLFPSADFSFKNGISSFLSSGCKKEKLSYNHHFSYTWETLIE